MGHERVKKVLSVAVYNHYKRLAYVPDENESDPYAKVQIEKSNVLLAGPTGCGKTLMARTLARYLDIPFAIADATSLTEAGYVGEDVETILLSLIQNADFDIQAAETGIIYIDEIDKIGQRAANPSITRDVSGEGVQQALLKVLEGTVARVPLSGGRKHPRQKCVEINTEKILFVCGGTFVGLREIIDRRRKMASVGFGSGEESQAQDDPHHGHRRVEPVDLVQYGLIPELVGRLPVVTELEALSAEDLVRVLVEPESAMVKQYLKLMAMEGIKLSFTQSALREMARNAVERKTGARGLRAAMDELMLDIMYEAPSMGSVASIRVTERMVRDRVIPAGLIGTERKVA